MTDPRILRRRLAWLKVDFQYLLPNHPGYSDSDGTWDAVSLIDELRALLAERSERR